MEVLERRFAAIGARIKISGRPWRGVPEINVGVDPRGHDERHWFVAAVPESERGVSGVAQAMVALQPMSVREAVALKKPKHPLDRKNTAYMRQGEWFFVPTPGLDVDPATVLPTSRSRAVAATRTSSSCSPSSGSCPRSACAPTRRGARWFATPSSTHGERCVTRPRDDRAAHVAPRRDEHRAARACDASRRVPRLAGRSGIV